MAKRGTGNGWLVGLGALVVGWVLYAYSTSGRGTDNSPLIPDAIEDPIDRLVAALNQTFGSMWVNFGLNAVQSYIERTMPEVAWLVNAVYRVEQEYKHTWNASGAKKQRALLLVRT